MIGITSQLKSKLIYLSMGCIVSAVLVLGFSWSQSTYAAKETQQVRTQKQVKKIPLEDIKRFVIVISQIKRYYIEAIDDSSLFEKALRGMLSGLDPHSMYLNEQDLKELATATTGKFGGLGIELLPEKGLIRVISPIDDTPAAKAGIKAGDYIVRINNSFVKKMTLKEAIKMMRGKKGTKVTLTLLRKGEKKPIIVTLTRDIIKVKSVKSRLLEKGYGYIRIAFFQTTTQKSVITAIKKLKEKSGEPLKGLVLDLRNNPGGLLNSAIRVTDLFLDADLLTGHKLIVYTKGRMRGSTFKAPAKPGDRMQGIPIVVLINNGSASGAEILAGALQDHKRAVIMGTQSFGKGSVQTVIPIDRKSSIKLTTALYYTPAGTSIQAKGIKPDIIVTNLKLPKAKADGLVFKPINESDLKDHFANGQQPKTKPVKTKITKKEKALAHTDYQLYEGLNLLKGLNATRK